MAQGTSGVSSVRSTSLLSVASSGSSTVSSSTSSSTSSTSFASSCFNGGLYDLCISQSWRHGSPSHWVVAWSDVTTFRVFFREAENLCRKPLEKKGGGFMKKDWMWHYNFFYLCFVTFKPQRWGKLKGTMSTYCIHTLKKQKKDTIKLTAALFKILTLYTMY